MKIDKVLLLIFLFSICNDHGKKNIWIIIEKIINFGKNAWYDEEVNMMKKLKKCQNHFRFSFILFLIEKYHIYLKKLLSPKYYYWIILQPIFLSILKNIWKILNIHMLKVVYLLLSNFNSHQKH